MAVHAAIRARRDAGRRRAVERRAAELACHSPTAPAADGLGAIVHEEVDRLPDRFRRAVILCDLEGRSLEEAAQSLGCPVGTVKSRLARGRDRLRGRLTRRGLAPAAIGASLAAMSGSASAGVPASLVGLAAGAALRSATAPAAVATLAREVIRSMTLTHLGRASSWLLVAATALGGLATVGVSMARQAPGPTAPQAKAPAPPASKPAETLSWRRTDRYEPPDFSRFFPNDPEGAARLRPLWDAADKDKRPDEEVFRMVRGGLRGVEQRYRMQVVRWLGHRYITGRQTYDPMAVEILYHAAGAGENRREYDQTRHFAVYFGLSMIEPKTPAILHALADLCLLIDDPNDLDRIIWGTTSQRAEILAFITPELTAADPARRDKAALLLKMFHGEVKPFEWAAERMKEQMRAKFGARLPGIRRDLESNDPGAAARRWR